MVTSEPLHFPQELASKFSNPWRTMLTPFQHLDDCAGSHYRLQLNCYRWMLQTYYNVTVSEMYIVGTHPDNNERAFVDCVPVMHAEVEALMYYQRQRAREVAAMIAADDFVDPSGGVGGGTVDLFGSQASMIPEDTVDDLYEGGNAWDAPPEEGLPGISDAGAVSAVPPTPEATPASAAKRRRLTRKASETHTQGSAAASGAGDAKRSARARSSSGLAPPLIAEAANVANTGGAGGVASSGTSAPAGVGSGASGGASSSSNALAVNAGAADSIVPMEPVPVISARFGAIFNEASDAFLSLEGALEADEEVDSSIMRAVESLVNFVHTHRPHWPARIRHLAVGALWSAQHRLVDQGSQYSIAQSQ
jgi:hypothetical protein